MADQTFDRQRAAARVGRLLGTAATTRNEMLQSFAEDAQQEAAALRKVRDALARKTGADDPAVQALDRRTAGTERVADFTRKTLEEIGSRDTAPPVGDWVVAGQVLDAKDKPVAGASIQLVGDPALGQRFGEVASGKDGKFEVRFPGAAMKEVFARAPKVKLVVRSKDGKLESTTAEIVPRSDGIDLLSIRLAPPATPDSDQRPPAKKGPAAGKKDA